MIVQLARRSLSLTGMELLMMLSGGSPPVAYAFANFCKV